MRIPYIHFPRHIHRSPSDSLLHKFINFFKMQKVIKDILEQTSPDLVVLALDSDPIAQIFIKESKRRGIKTVLIQEGLIRPLEYTMRKTYISDYFYKLLRLLGIYLAYTIKYGTGGCDKILVSGKIASDILQRRGVLENRITIIGHPKYDGLIKNVKSLQPVVNQQKVYLFAASTKIFHDDQNVRFLRKLVEAAKKLGFHLIVKLHPRANIAPSDIYTILKVKNNSFLEIIKEGDETFEILKKSDVLITVFSTVILEALMMNKECVVTNYLAGESRLDYDQYNAIYSIKSENEIYNVLKNSMLSKKSYQNKKTLLEDELYRLDGKAGERSARFIESMIAECDS